jgi:hypothetical protein
MNYSTIQEAFVSEMKLKKGDRVKVMRKPIFTKRDEASTMECNWTCAWHTSMDKHVGKTYTVKNIDFYGVSLENGYYYPVFILQKVTDAVEPIKINHRYSAEIKNNGDVKVGCTTVSYAILKKIYNAATKQKEKK